MRFHCPYCGGWVTDAVHPQHHHLDPDRVDGRRDWRVMDAAGTVHEDEVAMASTAAEGRTASVVIRLRGLRGEDMVSDVHAVGCREARAEHYRTREVMTVAPDRPLVDQLSEFFDNGRVGPDGEAEIVGEVGLRDGVEGFRIMDCVARAPAGGPT